MKTATLIFFKLFLLSVIVPILLCTKSFASQVDEDMGQCWATLVAMQDRNMNLSQSQWDFIKKGLKRYERIGLVTDKCDRSRPAQECIAGKLNQEDTDFFWGAGKVKKSLATNFYTKTHNGNGYPFWEVSYLSCGKFREISSK